MLDLRGNALTALPKELSRCTALEVLHIGGNGIKEFEQELCVGLVNLKELYLYRNKIQALPLEVGKLNKLFISSNKRPANGTTSVISGVGRLSSPLKPPRSCVKLSLLPDLKPHGFV